jgi:hypothetical protein
MHTIETISVGEFMPHNRKRYVNLAPEWTDFKPGSIVVEANNEEVTLKFQEWYEERDGSKAALCVDSVGTRRYIYADAIRLVSLNGRGKSRGRKGESLLTDAESKLSRAEKRKLRRERREPTEPMHAEGID